MLKEFCFNSFASELLKRLNMNARDNGVMNPFVDWGFKYLFGTERSKKNLLGFLNLLLDLQSPIVDLQYLNNESIPLDKDGRECVFDILCKDENGEKYLIEVQNAGIGYMQNRMIYYACRLVDKMGEQGKDWKYNFNKVYSICLMNYTYEEHPVLRRDFVLCEPGTENILSDKLNFVMLQLPCLDKDYLNECDFFYEKLLYLLVKMKEGMKTIEQLKQEVYEHGLNEHIKEVFLGVLEDADVASLSPKEREVYDIQLKRYRDNHACLDYAIENGIKQGIEKGIKQGIAQGKELSKIEVAKSMKDDGVDFAIISKYTGIPVEDIIKL